MRRTLLPLLAASSWTTGAAMPAAAAAPPTVDVTFRSMRYDPVTLSVAEGTRVRGNNVSPSRAHDVVSSMPGYIRSPLMVDGQSFGFTFSAAGTFTYNCSIHDVMIGAVGVPLQGELGMTGRTPYVQMTLGTGLLATAPGTYHFRARPKDKVGGRRTADTPVVTLDYPAGP